MRDKHPIPSKFHFSKYQTNGIYLELCNLGLGISNDEPSSLMIRLNHDIGKSQLA